VEFGLLKLEVVTFALAERKEQNKVDQKILVQGM